MRGLNYLLARAKLVEIKLNRNISEYISWRITVFNFFKKKDEKVMKDDKVSVEYLEWRKLILNMQPKMELKNISDEVYGMLLDVGMGDIGDKFLVISMYAFNTGEASLKASPGAGIAGLGDARDIFGIPEKIVEMGQALVSSAKSTDNFDYPEENWVQFFFITTSGVRVYKCNLRELQSGHPFNDMFNRFTDIKRVADKLMSEVNNKKNNPQ